MQLLRMFSTEKYKGSRDYLRTQKKYEILRTCLYFGVSLSLFFAGFAATKTRMNLLTVVAILGCLPASKSLISMIMYLRFSGCSGEAAGKIAAHSHGVTGLYDMVFTSYQKNYSISHLTVRGNTICGYTEDDKFSENDFYRHIDGILKTDNFKNVSVKVFTDLTKYLNRLEQLKELEPEETVTEGIVNTLKSVSL